MTSFQILVIIISALSLLSGIVVVYIKTQIDIAKIQTALKFFQRDLDSKEVSILKLETNNRDDHKLILEKIDKIIEKIK